MTKSLYRTIIGIASVLAVALAPASAFAFSVSTSNLPFNASNLVPGNSVVGSFTINNSFDSALTAQIESVNGTDPDNLASEMTIEVFEGGTGGSPIFSKALNDFMTSGIHELTQVSANGSKEYTLRLTLDDDAPSSYMGTSLGFDLCVGLKGENTAEICGEIVISPENPVPNNPGGGGGGTSGQTTQLLIWNEASIAGEPQVTSALITWETNKLATSQVIYGPASGAPYTLDIDDPDCMGYPECSTEDPTKVTYHQVVIGGLAPGDYVYRVVSHASPATVSPEHSFSLVAQSEPNFPLTLPVDNPLASTTFGDGADDGGEDGFATTTDSGESASSSDLSQAAAALFAGDFSGLTCSGIALLIFALGILLAYLISKMKKNSSFKRDIIAVTGTGLAATIILLFLDDSCPLLPLWVIIAAYVIFRLIRKNKNK